MRRWHRCWRKALVHRVAEAVQHVGTQWATGVQGQKIHCSLASQRDADPLRLLLCRFLCHACGIPIGKLRFVNDFGLSLCGHVKHRLLVMAPGVGRQIETAGTVLHQLDRAVEHGLAELLQGHGSLLGGSHAITST